MWYLATIPMVLFLGLLIYQLVSERKVNLALDADNEVNEKVNNQKEVILDSDRNLEKEKNLVKADKSTTNELRFQGRETKRFQAEVQKVSKSLSALNIVYEMELKDAKTHTRALNKFYSNISGALESMAEAGKETTAFQQELNKLTSNITALNKVYGKLTAETKKESNT